MWRQEQVRKLELQECASIDFEQADCEDWDWPAGNAMELIPVDESSELEQSSTGAPRRVASLGGSDDGADHESLKRSDSEVSWGSDSDRKSRSRSRRYRKSEAQSSIERSDSALSDVGSLVETVVEAEEQESALPMAREKTTSFAGSDSSAMDTPLALEGEEVEPTAKPIQEEDEDSASVRSDVRHHLQLMQTLPTAAAAAPQSSASAPQTPAAAPPSRVRGRAMSLESWEDWRTDFPLEVLDALADFYEDVAEEDDGTKTIPVLSLQQVTAKVLGFPPQVVLSEVEASGLKKTPLVRRSSLMPPDPGDPRGVVFSTLTQFLALLRGTVSRMEREHIELIWSQEDLQHVQGIFRRHANSSNCIPMAILFEVIQELGFEDLSVGEVEQQRWLADVTRCTLAGRRASSNNSVGTVSIEDFVRIVTFALRDKERARRSEEFSRERQARKLAGFTPVEMEDLRELHHTYAKLEVPIRRSEGGGKDPLIRMTVLLQSCGISNLSDNDASKLQRIVRKLTPSEDMERIIGDCAPFDVFMLWMREVLAQSIGNLKWKGGVGAKSGTEPKESADKFLPTDEELAGRKGFTAAMLREALRSSFASAGGQYWDAIPESGSPREPGEAASPGSRRKSNESSRRESADSLAGLSRFASEARGIQRSSEARSRKPTLSASDGGNVRRSSGDVQFLAERRRSGEPQMTMRHSEDNASLGFRSMSKENSRITSLNSSQSTVASRGFPAPGSRSRMSTKSRSRAEGYQTAPGSSNTSQANSRRGSLATESSPGTTNGSSAQGGAGKSSVSSTEEPMKTVPRGKAASGGSVFVLKGLPTNEAILSRKEFRACSVDLSTVTGFQAQIAAQVDALARGSDRVADANLPKGEEKGTQRRSNAATTATLPQLQSPEVSKSGKTRKMKPVQDSLAIVNTAIARLSEEQALVPGSLDSTADSLAPT